MIQYNSLSNESWSNLSKGLKVETKITSPKLTATQVMGLSLLITSLEVSSYRICNTIKDIENTAVTDEDVIEKIKELTGGYKSKNNDGVTYIAHMRVPSDKTYDTFFIDSNTLEVVYTNNLISTDMFSGNETCETDRIYNKFKIAPHFAYIFACLQNGFNGLYLTDDDIQEAFDKVTAKGISYEGHTAYCEDAKAESVYYRRVIDISYIDNMPMTKLSNSFESHVLHELDLKFNIRRMKGTPRKSKAQINYFFLPYTYKKSINLRVRNEDYTEKEVSDGLERANQTSGDINIFSSLDYATISDTKVDFKTGDFSLKINSQEKSYKAILDCTNQLRVGKVFLDVLGSLRGCSPLTAWKSTISGNYNDKLTARLLHETSLWRVLVMQGINTIGYKDSLPSSMVSTYEALNGTIIQTVEDSVLNKSYTPRVLDNSNTSLPSVSLRDVIRVSMGIDTDKKILTNLPSTSLSTFSDFGLGKINSVIAYIITQLDFIVYKFLSSRVTQMLYEVHPTNLSQQINRIINNGVTWFMKAYNEESAKSLQNIFDSVDFTGYDSTAKDILAKYLKKGTSLAYRGDKGAVISSVKDFEDTAMEHDKYTEEYVLTKVNKELQHAMANEEDYAVGEAYKIIACINELAELPRNVIEGVAYSTESGTYYFYSNLSRLYGDAVSERIRSVSMELGHSVSETNKAVVRATNCSVNILCVRALCLVIIEEGLLDTPRRDQVLMKHIIPDIHNLIKEHSVVLPKPKKFKGCLYGVYKDMVQFTPDDLGKLILVGRLGVSSGIVDVVNRTSESSNNVSIVPLKDIENDEPYVSTYNNGLRNTPKEYYRLILEFAKEALKDKHTDTLMTTLDGDYTSRRAFMDVFFMAHSLGVPMSQSMKLVDYILYDCVHRQRIGSEYNTISLYEDYVTAVKVLVDNNYRQASNFNPTPMSLRLEHDIAVYEHNKVKEELEEEDLLKAYDDTLAKSDAFKPLNSMKATTGKVYELIHPTTIEDLKKEGRDLSHCVGGYVSRIIEGNCLIFFLRDKKKPDKSYVTVEFKVNKVHKSEGGVMASYSLGQVLGRNNKPIINGTPLMTELRNRVKLLNDYEAHLRKKEELRTAREKKKLEKQQELQLEEEKVNN